MANDKPGNQTAGTPDLSETELREMKVDDLRERARDEGVSGSSSMKKDELVDAISALHRDRDTGRGGLRDGGEATAQDLAQDETGTPGDRGPDGGRMRTGPQSSKSLKYSQEITSLDDDPERAGRSLVTTSHEVIRQWAEERDGVPATVEGTEHGDRAGVLRFDFGERTDKLRHITWEEWFRTFDERHLNFLYQEERKDGRQSTFFRLENPEREDA